MSEGFEGSGGRRIVGVVFPAAHHDWAHAGLGRHDLGHGVRMVALPPVIGNDASRSPGAKEDLSSSDVNLATIPSPLHRRVPPHQECVPWPSPCNWRLGSS